MQSTRTHPKRSVWFLRLLMLVLIGVTVYTIQVLTKTGELYTATSAMISEHPSVVSVVTIGDKRLAIPSYELFQEDQLWSIISKDRPLSDEKGFSLVESPVAHGDEHLPMRVAKIIANDLEHLINAAQADGESLMISSAHRTFAEQKQTYDGFVAKNGSELAAVYVLPVGASEHHTGLAVDFSSVSSECAEDSNSCSLSQTGASWLAENAHRFGFIQRYPAGKQAITGVGYEPWHYRYIGKPMARAIVSADLTLEEVVDQIAPGYTR